jgi:aminopeptidase
MVDARINILAKNLIRFSCGLKAGEKVLIESIGGNEPLTQALIREAYEAGGAPFVWLGDKGVDRALLMGCTDEQLKLRAELDGEMMSRMQAYIGIRGGSNASELSDVPQAQIERNQRLYWEPCTARSVYPRQNG